METVQKPEGVHKIGIIRYINLHNICIKNRSRPPLCSVPLFNTGYNAIKRLHTFNIFSLSHGVIDFCPLQSIEYNKATEEFGRTYFICPQQAV